MGEGLYRTEPRFRAHVDRMSAVLAPLLGFDLRAKLYPAAAAEAAADVGAAFDEPTVAQPAIFVTELALGRTLLELGGNPSPNPNPNPNQGPPGRAAPPPAAARRGGGGAARGQ